MRFVSMKLFTCLVACFLSACGAVTPNKKLFSLDKPDEFGRSSGARYENNLVLHIRCETAEGLTYALKHWDLPWLKDWGTSITLTITDLDQSGLSAGVTAINPLLNSTPKYPAGGAVTIAQMFSLGVGGSAAANATRTETIQYTYTNMDLLEYARQANLQSSADCLKFQHLPQIDGDLKIREFINDKAELAGLNNTSLRGYKFDDYMYPTFNTFTEEINFVSSFGGNITPSWKLARVSANTNGNFLAAMRTTTDDLVITIGPLQQPFKRDRPIQLEAAAQNQHNARVSGNAIATSIQSQAH